MNQSPPAATTTIASPPARSSPSPAPITSPPISKDSSRFLSFLPHSSASSSSSSSSFLFRSGIRIWGIPRRRRRERMGYVGQHGVATLRRYKYSGVDHSLVAKYILQPFWSRFVNLFPLWFPFHVSIDIGIPRLSPPRWVHLAHGMLLFLYQFEALAFGSTAMCGKATFWYWFIAAVPFYCATWEHFFTNTLILPIVNGPTEGLMLIYLCHFFTFFTGAEWWAQDFRKSIPLLNWVPLVPEVPVYGIALFLMIAFAVIPTIGSNIHNVYKVVEARKGSMLLALAMLFPFGLLLAGVLVWSYLSPSDIMRNQPHLLIIGTGFAFGFLVGRMILAHLCDEPKGLKTGMCMSLAYFPFAIANALTARLDDGNPLVDEQLVLLMYCLFTVALYMHFATSVIHEITNALGIHCFRCTE
uniref:Aminoalcoholphosphotransferase n=2 Tax=Oryza meridionalis TaxID=40149 RepID=A0A0E0CDZ6_9ORYZ